MKAYRLSKRVLKKTLYLLLMLLFFCVCATYPAGVHPAKVMTMGWNGMYLYDIHSNGKLEVFAIGNMDPEGMLSLEIEDFSDYSLVTSKKLSLKEIKVINQLITDVKNNSDSNYQPYVEDAAMIIAKIDEETYLTTYYDEWPDGNVDVRNLTHRLVELSPVNEPFG